MTSFSCPAYKKCAFRLITVRPPTSVVETTCKWRTCVHHDEFRNLIIAPRSRLEEQSPRPATASHDLPYRNNHLLRRVRWRRG